MVRNSQDVSLLFQSFWDILTACLTKLIMILSGNNSGYGRIANSPVLKCKVGFINFVANLENLLFNNDRDIYKQFLLLKNAEGADTSNMNPFG